MSNDPYIDAPQSELDEQLSNDLFIWICFRTECDLNPFVSSVPFCDRCGGSYCAPIIDGREGFPRVPIPANSERGRELRRCCRLD